MEIFSGGEWGTICNHLWDNIDASIVCKSLGFGLNGEVASFGDGTGPIVLDDVQCTGTESSILDCNHRGLLQHNCQHSNDAGVKCSGIDTDHKTRPLEYINTLS